MKPSLAYDSFITLKNQKINPMKKLFIYILPVMLLLSCAKGLDEYNVDQKNPSAVSAAPLFGNALIELTDNQTTSSININVFRLWTQQWTTTTYQDEPRYNLPPGTSL